MIPGIDTNLCLNIKCPNADYHTCKLVISRRYHINCPIPDKCLFKVIQLLLSKQIECHGDIKFRSCNRCDDARRFL